VRLQNRLLAILSAGGSSRSELRGSGFGVGAGGPVISFPVAIADFQSERGGLFCRTVPGLWQVRLRHSARPLGSGWRRRRSLFGVMTAFYSPRPW
jgi:hypothetical protein